MTTSRRPRERRAPPPDEAFALLERLRYGVLITAVDGEVTGHNHAAATMVASASVARRRCCDLLGCRQPGTALSQGCITELALRAPQPLPEIRVDLAGTESSAWVTAARLAESAVVIGMRAARRGDRRRRSEPDWAVDSALRMRCLGPLRVETDAGPIRAEWMQHRPGQVLGYLIAQRGRPVSTAELATGLWPDSDRARLSTVRYLIHVLRRQLEPARPSAGASTIVVFRSGGYVLDEHTAWLDADEFEGKLDLGLGALATDVAAARTALEGALDLYGGDFLADQLYADWARPERDRLHARACECVRALIQLATARGDLAAARSYQMRLAELEPLDAGIHRELILHDLRRGRHSEAARRYATFSHRTRSALGRHPSFNLAALAEVAARSGP
jgi:DNA-binding SARP family transcriptional activator